jgi:hypothetical protein
VETTSMPTRTAVALAVLALVGLGSACSKSSSPSPAPAGTGSATAGALESNPSGDIPDNQAFVPFRDASGLFTVTVPEGWAQTTSGGAVVFSDKYNEIRVLTRSTPNAPSPTSVTNGDLPAIKASSKGFAAGGVSTVTRKAGVAVLATYRANSAPNTVTGKYAVEAVERYSFYRSGHEVILTLAAPVGSDNVDPWRKVTDSFSWLQP